jgi:hypothetical protein
MLKTLGIRGILVGRYVVMDVGNPGLTYSGDGRMKD